MNNLNLSDHSIKKQSSEFFIHVVRIAKADDHVSDAELDMLYQIGRKIGYSDLEIDSLIKTTNKSDYIPPYQLFDRFEQLYGIVKMTLADGVIDSNEMRLATNFALKSGFTEKENPRLLVLLISGIRQGKNEEQLFEEYKKIGNTEKG
jgi:hypothetical protein